MAPPPQPPNAESTLSAHIRNAPWRLILLTLTVILLTVVPFLLFGDAIEAWTDEQISWGQTHPWTVAALLCLLLSVDVVAPIPSSLVSTACGTLLGFWGGMLTSFVGMTCCAVLGYLLGRCASGTVRRTLDARELATLHRLHGAWGIWMLAAVRPVPVLAEASLVFMGFARLPWKQALPILLLANLAVSAVYAAIGALAVHRDATGLAFLAAALLSGSALLLFRRR